MSSHHEDLSALLDDWMDGALPPERSREVEAHLTACRACSDEVAALREIRSAARRLPREIPPPRDLWPDIAARLEPRRTHAGKPVAGRRFRGGWLAPLLAAAAALVLVIGSSVLTAHFIGSRLSPTTLDPTRVSPGARTALAAFEPTEAAYLGTVEALTLQLEAGRDRLAPETVAVVEENLRIIDDAIAEARAALASDPGSVELPLLLSTIYQRKVQLLQRVIALQENT